MKSSIAWSVTLQMPIGNLCMKELEPATVFEHLLKLISKIDEREIATSSIAKKEPLRR